MTAVVLKLFAVAVTAASILTFSSTPAVAQATVERTPISGSVFATVPDFCLGETFSGNVSFGGHMLTVTNPSGGETEVLHLTYVHGIVFGDETGTLLQGTQAEQSVSHSNGNNDQFTGTIILNFSSVTRGSADNMLVRILLHMTVNADGEVTTQFGGLQATCRA